MEKGLFMRPGGGRVHDESGVDGMKRIQVHFAGEEIALDLSEETLVGAWTGPPGLSPEVLESSLRETLEKPLSFPPLHQLVVPGDRVVVALDASLPFVSVVLGVVADLLGQHGREPAEISVIATPTSRRGLSSEIPRGLSFAIHDPAEKDQIAYLASTTSGRRVYLDRRLTDADVVLPIGRLGYDPILGYRGPWSTIFPGMSDEPTQASFRQQLAEDPAERVSPRPHLDESFEVSWLLGSQFQLGLVPGRSGIADVAAGLSDSLRTRGIELIDGAWNFRPEIRAECVIVGIGSAEGPSEIDDLVEGLVTASRLVRQGGRIVALTRVAGEIGPSLQRIAGAGDPRRAGAALRGHESDADSIAGRQLARVLDWADVYLLSGMDRQSVEDLCMIPLDHPHEAQRLAARSDSCLVVNRAEWTRGTVESGDARS
jgi:hypothetical protein